MTPMLRKALEAAGRMSPEEQDALALVLLDELDGPAWTRCLGAFVESEEEPRDGWHPGTIPLFDPDR